MGGREDTDFVEHQEKKGTETTRKGETDFT